MIDYGLKNKVVLITGANNPQGIGAATAYAFAAEGAKIILVYKKNFTQAIPKNGERMRIKNDGISGQSITLHPPRRRMSIIW